MNKHDKLYYYYTVKYIWSILDIHMKQSRAGDVLPRNKVSNSFASPGPPSSSSSSPRKKGTTLKVWVYTMMLMMPRMWDAATTQWYKCHGCRRYKSYIGKVYCGNFHIKTESKGSLRQIKDFLWNFMKSLFICFSSIFSAKKKDELEGCLNWKNI